jgi:oxalate---CoA ligase
MIFNYFQLGTIIEQDGLAHSGLELCIEAERKAAYLAARGAQQREYLLISHGNSAEFFTDLFAVWLLGGCAVCVNPNLTEDERCRIINLVNPRFVLGGSDGEGVICGVETLNLKSESVGRKYKKIKLPGGGTLDDEALVLFTSGTTGKPKGVVHTFRSLYSRILSNLDNIKRSELSTTLCPLGTHFGHGLIGICLTTLVSGGAVVLCDGTKLATTARLGEIIDHYNISFLSSVPSLWRVVLKLSKPPESNSLRRINIGSAPLTADLWERVVDWSGGREVANVYGITETANWIGGASSMQVAPSDGLVGQVWTGKAAVLTERGEFSPTGFGEIIVQTPSLMKGYFGLSDESVKCLSGGYFRTGDLGVVDADQSITIKGRVRSQINRAGVKVIPEEIDMLLEQNPMVSEACAFPIADEIAGELIGVAVTLVEKTGQRLDEAQFAEELKKWMISRISKDKLADKFVIVEAIPKNNNGKIDRSKLSRSLVSSSNRA